MIVYFRGKRYQTIKEVFESLGKGEYLNNFRYWKSNKMSIEDKRKSIERQIELYLEALEELHTVTIGGKRYKKGIEVTVNGKEFKHITEALKYYRIGLNAYYDRKRLYPGKEPGTLINEIIEERVRYI